MDALEQKALQEYIAQKFSNHFSDYYDLMRANMIQASITGEVFDLVENHTIPQASARLDQAIRDNEWKREIVNQAAIAESHKATKKVGINPFGFFFGAKAESADNANVELKQSSKSHKPE